MTRWRERLPALAATAFGLGYVPGAPGTAGSLAGVAIIVLIAIGAPASSYRWLIGIALLALCVLSIALAPWAERYWGKKDPGAFVLDEVAGILVTALVFRVENVLALIWVTSPAASSTAMPPRAICTVPTRRGVPPHAPRIVTVPFTSTLA